MLMIPVRPAFRLQNAKATADPIRLFGNPQPVHIFAPMHAWGIDVAGRGFKQGGGIDFLGKCPVSQQMVICGDALFEVFKEEPLDLKRKSIALI